jgi:predicted carbohydrate-binding protein with CBM5 and CBM33 domain
MSSYRFGHHCQATCGILAVILLCCTAFQYANAHGYMSQPLSRPLKANLMQGDWAIWGNEYTPQQVSFLMGDHHHTTPYSVQHLSVNHYR